MATMTASPPDEKTIQDSNRPTGKGSPAGAPRGVTRRRVLGARFFLPKSGANGHLLNWAGSSRPKAKPGSRRSNWA